MNNEDLVSVIIVSLNRKKELKECIDSIFNQTYTYIEMIVIDNNSTTDVTDMLRKYKLTLIRNKKNLGACIARNQGIKICRGNYVLFIDSDAELYEKDTIAKMANVMKSDRNIGGVSPAIWQDPLKKSIFMSTPYLKWDGSIDRTLSFRRIKEKESNVDYLCTCMAMTRLDILKEVGGFDPFYFYRDEDADLFVRIKKKEYKLVVDPNINAWHKEGSGSGRIIPFNYITHKTYLVLKNYSYASIVKFYINTFRHDIHNKMKVGLRMLFLFLYPFIILRKNKSFLTK